MPSLFVYYDLYDFSRDQFSADSSWLGHYWESEPVEVRLGWATLWQKWFKKKHLAKMIPSLAIFVLCGAKICWDTTWAKKTGRLAASISCWRRCCRCCCCWCWCCCCCGRCTFRLGRRRREGFRISFWANFLKRQPSEMMVRPIRTRNYGQRISTKMGLRRCWRP